MQVGRQGSAGLAYCTYSRASTALTGLIPSPSSVQAHRSVCRRRAECMGAAALLRHAARRSAASCCLLPADADESCPSSDGATRKQHRQHFIFRSKIDCKKSEEGNGDELPPSAAASAAASASATSRAAGGSPRFRRRSWL